MTITATRLGNGPIIRPHMDPRMGDNINGPSLIRAPGWLDAPLGRYYLYFAHHDGAYIRLAYADKLTGPWRMHEPGVLPLTQSGFSGHIASPDVHVDENAKEIRLYFHGSNQASEDYGPQSTRLATSSDGLDFTAQKAELGRPYMRIIRHDGWHYAIAMPGIFSRSRNGVHDFEDGPSPFPDTMRHAALLLRDNRLFVFFTRIGDAPERILAAQIDITAPWNEWQASPPETVLSPDRDYEGAAHPNAPSRPGLATAPVRQLRDPAVFVEGRQTTLLYSVAGERGIAIAHLNFA